MITYSINYSSTTKAITQDIIESDKVNLSNVLNLLPDNMSYSIEPIHIRSVIATLNEHNIIRDCGSYIAVNNSNPDITNSDVNDKILLGKRAFNSNDIMSNELLSSDTDIFLYNTKSDKKNNDDTIITLITSTISTDDVYMKSSMYDGASALSLDFINKNHNTYLSADRVKINALTVSFTSSDMANGNVMTYKDNNITLKNPIVSGDVDYKDVKIYGKNVYLNGYPLEFSDNRPCMFKHGAINYGDTFDKMPLSELLRRIIYTNVTAKLTLTIESPYSNGFIEVNTQPTVIFEYVIIRGAYNFQSATMTMMTDSFIDLSNVTTTMVKGTSKAIIVSGKKTNLYKMTVRDIKNSEVSATASLTTVYPIYYGLSTTDITNSLTLRNANLNKLLYNNSTFNVQCSGSGYLYVLLDNDYTNLNSVYDMDKSSVITMGVVNNYISSPDGSFVSKKYSIYKSVDIMDSVNIRVIFN